MENDTGELTRIDRGKKRSNHHLYLNIDKKPPRSPLDLVALVRSVQRDDGHEPCFGAGQLGCDELDCDWRAYCLTRADLRRQTA